VALDDAEQELMGLAEGIDIEEILTWSMWDADDDDEEDDDNDIDKEEEEEDSLEACAKLNASTWPVKRVLVKVRPLGSCCIL
jgi:hypothetical protein